MVQTNNQGPNESQIQYSLTSSLSSVYGGQYAFPRGILTPRHLEKASVCLSEKHLDIIIRFNMSL